MPLKVSAQYSAIIFLFLIVLTKREIPLKKYACASNLVFFHLILNMKII